MERINKLTQSIDDDAEMMSPAPVAPSPAAINKLTQSIDDDAEMMSPAPVAPSPAAYMECGGTPKSGRRRNVLQHRPLDEAVIERAWNYGSEDDSDDEVDDLSAVFGLAQELPDTPIDDDDAGHTIFPNMVSMCPESPPPAGMKGLFDLSDPPPVDPVDTMEPRDLYDFQWRVFSEPPVDPSMRREPFSAVNVGPTIPLTDPYEIFTHIWNREIVACIAGETNRYAQQKAASMMEQGTMRPDSRITRWEDATINEIYTFFAVLIAMGSVVKNTVQDYWSQTVHILSTPGFASYMSYNRYSLIMSCLHFRNNDDMFDAELSYAEAKLFKIEPIIKYLNSKFQDIYVLGQNLSLDESLLLWKGRLDINVLIPNKAASIGIKSFEVCESQTGYLWRFEIHAQKKGSVPQNSDILKMSTPAIVLRLVKGLENKGYTLWMDNYYNSPVLARHLKSIGFDCVGTLRTNRMFVPQAIHSISKADMQAGQITGVTSGDVDIMLWRDANRVAMISTYHGNAVVSGPRHTVPILIHDYNIAMGGVDKKDQMLSYYLIERKRSKVWYKKLFKRLLNISIHNAYIIHRMNTQRSNVHTMTPKQFREKLIQSLLEKHGTVRQSEQLPARQEATAPITGVPEHRLSEYPFAGLQRQRRQCIICKRRVSTFCVGCQKTMCIAGECFVVAHTTLNQAISAETT